jgi:hypothetical protein
MPTSKLDQVHGVVTLPSAAMVHEQGPLFPIFSFASSDFLRGGTCEGGYLFQCGHNFCSEMLQLQPTNQL